MEETSTVEGQAAQTEASAEATGGGEERTTDTMAAQPDGQAGSEADALEKKDLPPELQAQQKELLRAFHAKTQAIAEKEKTLTATAERYKSDAEVLYSLGKQEWFKRAMETEKSRRSGKSVEVTDEQFQALTSDKRAFADFMAQHDRGLTDSMRGEFKAEFEKLSKNQQEILTSREFDGVAQEYGEEFTMANESGELETYLKEGLSYERAFKLYMADQGKVARKSQDRTTAATKRTGAVEKGGMAQVRGGPVHKAKSLNDALDIAFDLARKGVKDYRVTKE